MWDIISQYILCIQLAALMTIIQKLQFSVYNVTTSE